MDQEPLEEHDGDADAEGDFEAMDVAEQDRPRDRERERRGSSKDRSVYFRPVEVEVKDNLEKAMRALKNRMSKEGVLQELKRRRFYEKPSVRRKRKEREALKRLRRAARRAQSK